MKKYKFPSEETLKKAKQEIIARNRKTLEEEGEKLFKAMGLTLNEDEIRLNDISLHIPITYQDLKNKLIEGQIYSMGNFLILDNGIPVGTQAYSYDSMLKMINSYQESNDVFASATGSMIWVQTEEGWCDLNLVEVVEINN